MNSRPTPIFAISTETVSTKTAPADTEQQRGGIVVGLTTLAPFYSMLLVVMLLVVLTAVSPSTASAQPPEEPKADPLAAAQVVEQAFVDAIARAEASVVAISESADPKNLEQNSLQLPWNPADNFLRDLQNRSHQSRRSTQAIGAGVIINPDGLILTQYLIAYGDRPLQVTLVDGTTLPASVKAADPRSGLAILEVRRKDLSAITLGQADELRKGQLVLAIGNPQAILASGQPSVSWGIISNLAKKVGADINLNNTPDSTGNFNTTLHHLGTLIQTDAKLTFAMGGGALVNLQGEMIGLTTDIATIAGHEKPAGYAIPMSSTFRRIIESLEQGREVEYGLLGVGLGPKSQISKDGAVLGVVVQDVIVGGPAQQAGLLAQDVITHVDDQPVETPRELQLLVGAMPPAKAARVRFLRGGSAENTTVQLAKYPQPGRVIATNIPPSWRGMQVDYTTMQDIVRKSEDAVTTKPDAKGCVIICQVEPNSSSWQAGIRPGMFISHVGERRVSTPAEFREEVAAANGSVGIRLTEPLLGHPAVSPETGVIEPVEL